MRWVWGETNRRVVHLACTACTTSIPVHPGTHLQCTQRCAKWHAFQQRSRCLAVEDKRVERRQKGQCRHGEIQHKIPMLCFSPQGHVEPFYTLTMTHKPLSCRYTKCHAAISPAPVFCSTSKARWTDEGKPWYTTSACTKWHVAYL